MPSRRDVLLLLALAAACAILWAPLWSGERTLYVQDVSAYFYPMKDLLGRAVRASEWPWWNPWIRNGLPFFANPEAGLFYPLSALFYVLPTALALNWVVLLHFAALVTGFYVWLRRDGRSPWGAALGALAIGWGGYAISMSTYLNNLQAIAWTGWALWAWSIWLDRGNARWLAITALGFALQFLGGEPQVTVFTAALALGWAWTRNGVGPSPVRWWVPLAGLAGAAAGAVAVSAVQLVSTVELFTLSARSGGLSSGELLTWSLEPMHLSNLFLPRSFDGPDGLFDFRRVLVAHHPWVFTSYLGVVTVALAAGAPGGGWRSARWFWAAVSIVGGLLALGEHLAPAGALVEAMSGTVGFRYPQKFLLLPALGVPILASAGFDALGEREARLRVLVTAAALGGVAVVGWGVVDAEWVRAAAGRWDPAPLAVREPAWVVEGFRDAFLHVLAFCAISGAIVALAPRIPPRAVGPLLVLLVLADVSIANQDAVGLAPAELYREEPAVLAPIPAGEVETRFRMRTSPMGRDVGGWFAARGAPLATQHLYIFETMGPNLSMVHGILAEDGSEAFRPSWDDATREILRELPPPMQVRFLRLTSTAYLYERPLRLEGLERLPGDPVLGLHPYRLVDPLPRAYLVQRALVEPDSIAVVNHFVAAGEDPRTVAYLESGEDLPGPAEPAPGEVRWVGSGNHSVELDVESPVRTLLVLTDNHYPGWGVMVDGERAALQRVNWRFMGVYLEPGVHRVRFDFRPRWIGLSATVSVLALVGLFVVIARGGSRGA